MGGSGRSEPGRVAWKAETKRPLYAAFFAFDRILLGFFAKAVIVGPMMANFRDILARFKEDGAIVQVKDDEEFSDAVLALARDEGRRAVMGQKAAAVIAKNKGALERTLACVREITGPS